MKIFCWQVVGTKYIFPQHLQLLILEWSINLIDILNIQDISNFFFFFFFFCMTLSYVFTKFQFNVTVHVIFCTVWWRRLGPEVFQSSAQMSMDYLQLIDVKTPAAETFLHAQLNWACNKFYNLRYNVNVSVLSLIKNLRTIFMCL